MSLISVTSKEKQYRPFPLGLFHGEAGAGVELLSIGWRAGARWVQTWNEAGISGVIQG
jgi:hypothetical protein